MEDLVRFWNSNLLGTFFLSLAGGSEGLRALTNPKAVITDRWPSFIQTTIPKVLDYPLRSLSTSWYVLLLMRLQAVSDCVPNQSGSSPVVSFVFFMAITGVRVLQDSLLLFARLANKERLTKKCCVPSNVYSPDLLTTTRCFRRSYDWGFLYYESRMIN